ncbi:MAG: hypothetical protein K9M94_13050 [Spirochaetia bacterium]|nr:hypothetical protein [Spirochaetia bacterium]
MTALEIANLALLKLKASSLSSFNDSGYVATLVRTYLVFISDEVSLEYDWQFAKKRTELSENTTATNNTDYDHIYDLPSDCLLPRKLKGDAEYMVEYGLLYTNADSPVLIYTTNVMEMVDDDGDGTTPDVPQIVSGIDIPPLVEDAIASALASELAPKITESAQLQQQLAQAAAGSMHRAKQHDAKLVPETIEDPVDWGSGV